MTELAPPARADLQEVMRKAFRVRPLLWGFVGVLLVGFTCLVIYAAAIGGADALGIGLIVAAAALMAGAFLGFLFAIPRTPTQPAGTSATDRFRSNSNLEEISDWLTKILVGLGLVQFGRLLDGGRTLVDSIAAGLGDDPGSETFAGAVLVIFSVTGFLMGYVVTRAIVGPIFAQSEQAMRDFLKAVVAERVDSAVEKVGSVVDKKVEAKVETAVQEQVDTAVQEKVDTAVQAKVDGDMGVRIESLENKVKSLQDS